MKERFQQKIKDDSSKAGEVLGKYRSEGAKIVFTNGCFDLLHPGHLAYLQEAKALGDLLVIGLNDDASVSRLKGDKRPILKLAERAQMLAGLQMVDLVIPFSEDTPLRLIKEVDPDILVKGGDYEAEKIVGYDFMTERGGDVEVLSFAEGYSTSHIIDEIVNRFK